MPDPDPSTATVKRALRRLAFAVSATEPDCRAATDCADATHIVTRGIAAIDDIELAADFLTDVGFDRFEQALTACEREEPDSLVQSGREAAEAYRAFRRAANHFRSGRGTPLRRDAK
ncbi:hypothetical protein [Haladaptatus sp. DJG-WS-42]|uniref:hypothetical protein n=1 Tax=Haladaptatus sp. DJG-WS-42 TaxID=3120516 RepID=UPI0030CBB6E9